MTQILRLDASARTQGSVSRGLTDRLMARFAGSDVITRDLAMGMPLLDENWVNGTFTPPEMRSEAQNAALALSDTLVAEVQAADVIVIGTPIYNFNVPASLKAWIDQIARVGVTFHYTDTGPEGLLSGKKAIVVLASGGTPAGAPHDFATPYLRHVLGFVGITDVTFVDAAGAGEDALEAAGLTLDRLEIAA